MPGLDAKDRTGKVLAFISLNYIKVIIVYSIAVERKYHLAQLLTTTHKTKTRAN